MQPVATRMTVEEFEAYALHPDNIQRRLELIGGEMVELVSNRRSSKAGVYAASKIIVFVTENNLGEVTGADGGYQVGKDRYIPDAAFTSKARATADDDVVYYPYPPDLAVEVLSPTDDLNDFRIKISNYLAAGTVVWVFDPETKRAEVHAPGQPVQVIPPGGTLDGGTVLPGFKLALADVFG